MANTNGWKPPKIKMLQEKGIINLSDNASSFDYDHVLVGGEADSHINSLILEVTAPTGKTTPYTKNYGPLNSPYKYIDYNHQIILDSVGEYKLKFTLDWHKSGQTLDKHTTVTATTYIYVGSLENQIKNYTVADVINRLLDTTQAKRVEEPNKYKFDPVQLEEFSKIEAPEFAFTGHTLFEALLIVAQYLGSFPELKGDTISFRKLCNGRFITSAELPPPIEERTLSDIEQYCTSLDTEVQNFVGLNNSREATLVEPYAGGYKTTRSSGGSDISEDTAVIPTSHNLYQSIALKMGETNGKEIGDITPYVYEEGEYNSLSDTSGSYPNSKAYAVKWQQMSKDYTELTHRIKKESNFANAFEKPAISNIVQAKGGTANDAVANYLLQLFKPADKADSFADLMFRSEYVPIFNARIKQYKDFFGEFHNDGSIKYNQTAELVDSEMYGEHLKQLIRKIGNSTKRCVYIFDKIDDVPEVGTVVDGYSAYDVQMSIRENEVVATISYVKYAELSKYIGVKNAWKDSDVSVNKCYNRAISYNEFLLFSHDNTKNGKSTTLTTIAKRNLMQFTKSNPLTCVEATGYMKDGSKLNTVLLPVISLAVGNSLLFQWGYENNYSAGYMSEQAPDGATNAISGTKYNRAQKAVRYCDMYGRMETYDFSIMPTGPVPNGANMIWVEGVTDADDLETEKNVTDYPGTVDLTFTRNNRIGMHISEAYPVDIIVEFSVTTTEETFICTEIIPAGTVSISSSRSFTNKVSHELISAKCYDISDKTCYISASDVSRRIGYYLPLKPTELRKVSDLSQWEGEDYITVKNLLIEKNSSEALTFSVQLHYCTDNENFIIGSGVTNYCSLIGGEAKEVAFFGFNERINIFNRHLSVDENNRLGAFNYTVDSVYNRINIPLPSRINDFNAWALMGKDSNGNWQIIFGENKDLKGSAFSTELYLLPMHKLEDFV